MLIGAGQLVLWDFTVHVARAAAFAVRATSTHRSSDQQIKTVESWHENCMKLLNLLCPSHPLHTLLSSRVLFRFAVHSLIHVTVKRSCLSQGQALSLDNWITLHIDGPMHRNMPTALILVSQLPLKLFTLFGTEDGANPPSLLSGPTCSWRTTSNFEMWICWSTWQKNKYRHGHTAISVWSLSSRTRSWLQESVSKNINRQGDAEKVKY